MSVVPVVVPLAVDEAVVLGGLAAVVVLDDVVDVGVGDGFVAGRVVAFAVADLHGPAGGACVEALTYADVEDPRGPVEDDAFDVGSGEEPDDLVRVEDPAGLGLTQAARGSVRRTGP